MSEVTIIWGTEQEEEKYINIGVWDVTFFKQDVDGNSLLNSDGSVKLFRVDNYDCSYLADGLEDDDLTEDKPYE